MRTVRVVDDGEGRVDADLAVGDRLVLLKAAGEAWLVRDRNGDRRYVPADRLERVDESPLAAAAASVPEAVRHALTAVHDERTLGLLVEIADRFSSGGDTRRVADGPVNRDRTDAPAGAGPSPGPTSVQTLLSETALCESDLHGALAELEAAGLVARTETDVPGPGGGRAYRPTERGLTAVERLRAV